MLVARACLHAGRQKIIGDSLRDVAQNERAARIVEERETAGQCRELGADEGEIERHGMIP